MKEYKVVEVKKEQSLSISLHEKKAPAQNEQGSRLDSQVETLNEEILLKKRNILPLEGSSFGCFTPHQSADPFSLNSLFEINTEGKHSKTKAMSSFFSGTPENTQGSIKGLTPTKSRSIQDMTKPADALTNQVFISNYMSNSSKCLSSDQIDLSNSSIKEIDSRLNRQEVELPAIKNISCFVKLRDQVFLNGAPGLLVSTSQNHLKSQKSNFAENGFYIKLDKISQDEPR